MNQAEHPRVMRRSSTVKRLVVVADNPLIVGAIRSGVRDSGAVELLGYVNAANATARAILQAQPDVVLVDGEVGDPEVAVEFIRSLRNHDEDVHIIVLTLAMDSEWLRRALDAGADGAMSKVIRPSTLAVLMREVANGHIIHAPGFGASGDRAVPADTQHSALTTREFEILRLVASGATNADIARQLWITQQTVKFHVSNVYRKLGVNNRTEACRYAHVNGLLKTAAAPAGESPERALVAVAS